MVAPLKLSTWPSHVARKTKTLGLSHGNHSFSTPEPISPHRNPEFGASGASGATPRLNFCEGIF
jgi:hypothetical protein